MSIPRPNPGRKQESSTARMSKTTSNSPSNLKKGTKINTSPKTQTNRFQLSTRKILQKKKFYRHFQDFPVKIIMAPTPHYFSPATQNQPRHSSRSKPVKSPNPRANCG